MTLTVGSRLGPYDIVAPIGAGGMGEVYRAHDTKLNRDVALKVLPEAFTFDRERLARFRREAQVLASLNHPNIAHIYGFEDSGSAHALVLELVEGPTLADRIAKGPIPLEEALPIAKQIAEALEAAHEQGIIHRDLKPANIKVRDDGTVKVLDFGLAKAMEPASGLSAAPPDAATITTPVRMTGTGVILGTAAYMAPEQAKGKSADKRTDVWAFGCVLYEMLAGRLAFDGEDIVETLANVLKREPDLSQLPIETPASIRRLIRRCLLKDGRQRLAELSTARLEIEDATSFSVAADERSAVRTTSPRALSLWMAVAAMFAMATLAIAIAWRASSKSIDVAPASTQFLIYPPNGVTLTTGNRESASAVISPDGQQIAFTARDADGKTLLWVRPLASLTAHPIQDTDGASTPFWSPDNRYIAYFARGRLMKVRAGGGPSETLSEFTGSGGGAWSAGGTIVLGSGTGQSLLRLQAAGGQPTEAWPHGNDRNQQQSAPVFLPDGRHVIFYQWSPISNDVGNLYVGSLDTGETKRLATADSPAVFDIQSSRLLFLKQGTLYAQPFNLNTLTLTGEPIFVAARVAFAGLNRWARAFSVSSTGTLVFGTAADEEASLVQMTWVDQHGTVVGTIGAPANYRGIEISPDGARVAAHIHDGQGGDVWIFDVRHGTTSRLTFDPSQENSAPIWSADGRFVAFSSTRRDGEQTRVGIYRKASNGVGDDEPIMPGGDLRVVPVSWSPDETSIVFQTINPMTRHDLWFLPLADAHGAKPLVSGPFQDGGGQISPDGRWLAYHSNESGRFEVYVRPYPAGVGRWQISSTGGAYARWRRDGRSLFFTASQTGGMLYKVDVKTSGSVIEWSTPEPLFNSGFAVRGHNSSGGFYWPWAVSPDGQQFLMARPVADARTGERPAVAVLINWAEELKQRAPTK